MSLLRKAIKLCIPPIIFTLKSKIFTKKQPSIWSGNYASWQEAKALCTGYDSNEILEKCKDALLKVKNGDAIYERDSVLFDEIQYSWGLLAGLQNAGLENNGHLIILDFGGSLGSTYFQNRHFLQSLKSLKWCIVEQANFVNCGKKYFENSELQFFYTIEECIKIHQPNVLLLSSVLQYLEEPNLLIEKIIEFKFSYIILDRTAFIDAEKDILTIQNVPQNIYKASYPAWFFNKKSLLQKFSEYVVLAEIHNDFTADSIVDSKKVTWQGMILKEKK